MNALTVNCDARLLERRTLENSLLSVDSCLRPLFIRVYCAAKLEQAVTIIPQQPRCRLRQLAAGAPWSCHGGNAITSPSPATRTWTDRHFALSGSDVLAIPVCERALVDCFV